MLQGAFSSTASANQTDPTLLSCDGFGNLTSYVHDYPGGNSIHLNTPNPTGQHNYQIKIVTNAKTGAVLSSANGWSTNHTDDLVRCDFVGGNRGAYVMYGQFN